MTVGIVKRQDESWRDCVIRYAEPRHLKEQVIRHFDLMIELGQSEEEAALSSCEEWEVCEPIYTPLDMPE